MSELTTIARPYAKAAFEFAVEQSAVEKWTEMLNFAAEVVKNEKVQNGLKNAVKSKPKQLEPAGPMNAGRQQVKG